MRIRETDIDEQLDRLQNIEGGEVFFCGSRTNRNAFHNKTVAKLTQNKKSHTPCSSLKMGSRVRELNAPLRKSEAPSRHSTVPSMLTSFSICRVNCSTGYATHATHKGVAVGSPSSNRFSVSKRIFGNCVPIDACHQSFSADADVNCEGTP